MKAVEPVDAVSALRLAGMMGMQLPSLLRLLHHAGRGFLVLLLLPQLLHRAGKGLLLELPWQLLRRT